MFNLIACMTKRNRGIGLGNKMPWILQQELQYFKDVTSYNKVPNKKNVVIMGRNTFESLGKFLPKRHNMIISKTMEGDNIFPSLNDALLKTKELNTKTWVIGGQKLYTEALEHPLLNKIYLSELDIDLNCDTFFPKYNGTLLNESNNGNLEFKLNPDIDYECHLPYFSQTSINYKNNNIPKTVNWTSSIYENNLKGERDYLNLLDNVLTQGKFRETRNGRVKTLFGGSMTFNMENNSFPLLTTKKMFLRGISEELIMFLNSCTDTKFLSNQNINIWKGNTSKEFITNRGLNYLEGDMGPMYGFQWRNYGEDYDGYSDKYSGFDQLEDLLSEVIKNPTSRRLLFTTYNPADVSKSVLAPCHGLISQLFIEENDGIHEVSLQTYQRSADMFLGVPFNIASYGLLLKTIVEVLNNRDDNRLYDCKNLTIHLGDCHIYEEHINQVKTQLGRIPNKFPKINFTKRIKYLEDLRTEYFTISDYNCHGRLQADMVK